MFEINHNDYVEIQACLDKKTNRWYVENEPKFKSYFYVINERFAICDSYTKIWSNIDELFTTVTTNLFDIKEIRINAQISNHYQENGLIKKCKLFTLYDPLVILVIDLFTEKENTVVLSSEWICNGRLQWITAKPFEFNKDKRTFNALKITKDISFGKWTCNLYAGKQFVSQYNFEILNNESTSSPNATFINMNM